MKAPSNDPCWNLLGERFNAAKWTFDGPSIEFDYGRMFTEDLPGDNFAVLPYAIRTQFVTALYEENIKTIIEVTYNDFELRVGRDVPMQFIRHR